ncbi:MAG: ATP-binding cassette domain-containing protein [Gemmobacter sp.]|nr:ATP-binding cassette domain-containing protein [Gemmobacter sp.]
MNAAIRLRGVGVTYRSGLFGTGRSVHALQDVDLEVPAGSITGIVGESGSGKSTLGRVVLGLQKPTTGTVQVLGLDPCKLSGGAHQAQRRQIQSVFQDSGASLNPRRTIVSSVREGLDIHKIGPAETRDARAADLLEQVGLGREHLGRFPHSLSGGQRQRVNIARALAVSPRVLVADEPVSALDLSVQAQVLSLLRDAHHRWNLTMLLISHDLSVIRALCDHVVVMRQGRVVEAGETACVMNAPRMPYTMQLLADAMEIG